MAAASPPAIERATPPGAVIAVGRLAGDSPQSIDRRSTQSIHRR